MECLFTRLLPILCDSLILWGASGSGLKNQLEQFWFWFWFHPWNWVTLTRTDSYLLVLPQLAKVSSICFWVSIQHINEPGTWCRGNSKRLRFQFWFQNWIQISDWFPVWFLLIGAGTAGSKLPNWVPTQHWLWYR
jgi:hypothetical protein